MNTKLSGLTDRRGRPSNGRSLGRWPGGRRQSGRRPWGSGLAGWMPGVGMLLGTVLLVALSGAPPALASDAEQAPLVISYSVEVTVPQIDWWEHEGEGVDPINAALKAKALALIDELLAAGNVWGEYTLHLESDGLISVSMTYSAFQEYQAHPAHVMGAVTADVHTGIVYELADLFVSDRYIEVISRAVARGIQEQDMPTLYEFEAIQPDQGFYLTPDALVVFFQVYELAPYAWGFPKFAVPYEELLPIAKPDGPIARLAGGR